MKLINPKIRITMGLIGVMTSLVMLAFFLNIIPDMNHAVRQGRAALAETIAVYSTALVKTAKSQRLRDDLNLLTERNENLLSLALRRESGGVLVATGDHADRWEAMTGQYSKNSQVMVPIWAGGQKWGQLELRFKPLKTEGVRGLLKLPMVRMTLFMGLAGFLLYYFYLGKVLRQLDPSQAIPGRVRAALDTMAEGLLILDRKEQIVLANEAFSDMIDRSADSLLGYRAGELPWMNKAGEKIEKAQRPWIQSLRQGKVQKDSIVRLQLPEAELRTFKTNSSPVLGDSGNYAGVLVSFDDITELEEKEVELLNSKMEAEEANKAKSSFLANMSHEIRTPMNAILGFTEILKRGYIKNEKESLKYLNTIHSSGRNLLELINDILDLSKVESGRIEVEKRMVEPYATIHEVLQMLTVKADEKGIALAFRAEGALPREIETDPVRLRQIAFNLIGNSLKFTEEGNVSVTCRYHESASGPQLIMDITDTGIGMSEDALENIFDPFVQADNTVTRRFGGTGLGLAISRKFAQALGGDITVKSKIGKGSTFRVTLATGNLAGVDFLPPEKVNNFQKEFDAEDNYRWQFPHARVLVVDDGQENRELVKLLLEDAGLFVDQAQNGQQGVVKTTAGEFDVVLMDVQMPVMDGFTAVEILRKQGFKVPVIALTANAMKGFEDRCLEAGFTGYLSKPINIDQFMERMAQILGGRKVTKDLDSTQVPEIYQDVQQGAQPAADSGPIVSTLPAHVEKFRKIIVRFVKRLDEQLDALENAANGENWTAVADLAHWLKGAGGTVGFDVFTESAAQLERHAKDGEAPQIKPLIAHIRQMAKRIVVPQSDIAEASLSETKPTKEMLLPETLEPNASPAVSPKPLISRLANMKRLQPTILNFVDTLDEKIEKMEVALDKEDMTELASLAHWLKGAGGTVGYDDLTQPAATLESCARADHVEMASQSLKNVKLLVGSIVTPVIENQGNSGEATN
jgi:signal transduction histidine kinase/CheY-like chemotaxis protein/HPt (histidine-containing phosphotransfer) domain-containing protein